MKHLTILALFVALAASAPTSNEVNSTSNEVNSISKEVNSTSSSKEDNSTDILVVTEEFFPDSLILYTAEHEIVNLLFPVNKLNFNEDDDEDDDTYAQDQKILFFVEADLDNGIEYKGLSIFKNNVTTKILPTGTSTAADIGDSKTVFFGATDGLYIYNDKENTAEKYGSITDNIIDIARTNGTDIIYILTDKNEIFKVSENGTKKDKLDIVGAKQIVLDTSNNLYYYAEDKKPYVVTEDGTTKIEGLPSDPTFIKLLRPAYIIDEGVPIIVDNKAYTIFANGSSDYSEIDLATKPSAYSIEATLIQYYAHNKNIYEYNIAMLIFSDLLEGLKTFLDENKSEIETLSTRSISNLSP